MYVLKGPRHGRFQPGDRVGGAELESTVIHALRFAGTKVRAAISTGVWSHSTSTLSGSWKHEFAPNPDYLPGGSKTDDPSAPYKNIANDIAVDPKDPSAVLLALALALLRLGWNFGLVSGTAIITDSVPLATRAKTEGMVDVSIAVAGATGGISSGIVVAATSYPVLALTGGVLALAMLAAVAATAYRR